MENQVEISATTPDWQHINVTTLQRYLDSQAAINQVLELQGHNAVAVVDLLDQVTLPAHLPRSNLIKTFVGARYAQH